MNTIAQLAGDRPKRLAGAPAPINRLSEIEESFFHQGDKLKTLVVLEFVTDVHFDA